MDFILGLIIGGLAVHAYNLHKITKSYQPPATKSFLDDDMGMSDS